VLQFVHYLFHVSLLLYCSLLGYWDPQADFLWTAQLMPGQSTGRLPAYGASISDVIDNVD